MPWRPTWAELTVRDESDQPTAAAAPADDESQPKLPPRESEPRPEIPLLTLPAANNAAPKGAQDFISGRRAVSQEVIENAKDEVELMEAQLAGRKGELREVELRISTAQQRYARLEKLHRTGAAPDTEVKSASDDWQLLTAQREPKQAQVKEAEIRLRQAKRRLDALQPINPPPTRQQVPVVEREKPKADPNLANVTEPKDRLLELESKVERLLKEIGSLRNEIREQRR